MELPGKFMKANPLEKITAKEQVNRIILDQLLDRRIMEQVLKMKILGLSFMEPMEWKELFIL